jgi:hypothetical protein
MVVELPGEIAEHAKLNFPDIDSTISLRHYQKIDNQFTFKKPVQHYIIVSKRSKTEQWVIRDDQVAAMGVYEEADKIKFAKFKKGDAKIEIIPKKKKPKF